MSLTLIEEKGRCPKVSHGSRCLRFARHQSACRFVDDTAAALWQAVADLMGMLPVRYDTGGDAREIETPEGKAFRARLLAHLQRTSALPRGDAERVEIATEATHLLRALALAAPASPAPSEERVCQGCGQDRGNHLVFCSRACGCQESYPQLVSGRVSHGPGCCLAPAPRGSSDGKG